MATFPSSTWDVEDTPAPTTSTPQAGLVLVVLTVRGEVFIEARSVVDVTNTLSVGVVS